MPTIRLFLLKIKNLCLFLWSRRYRTRVKFLKFYTDMQQVLTGVDHPRFVFTDNEKEADILFNFSHFKDYQTLSRERPHVLLNQFPCENLLTVKDCLASVSRRIGDAEGPLWLPRTFNLKTELPQFISYFKQREERGEDNHWICKPWNLARSLDTHVTTNLSYITRQRESTPKVVSKYVEDPVLFHRDDDVGKVKFDIRYVLLLRSVRPLRLYTYNVFWLRFANRQIHCDEFITMFEKQYPEYPWKTIEAQLFKTFGELFQAATSKPAPLGICDYQSSRAVYAIDLMLKWDKDSEGMAARSLQSSSEFSAMSIDFRGTYVNYQALGVGN
ncbi:unnamed protein product [Ranitomeya imitator]|uniref:Uncharacterized protein n=1 Tax=Ranitomeya imitator TaxID=111125 RepID=A0ABN9MC26_9NEOB|nr:unnamed protein product [Ranitomeya imitator]